MSGIFQQEYHGFQLWAIYLQCGAESSIGMWTIEPSLNRSYDLYVIHVTCRVPESSTETTTSTSTTETEPDSDPNFHNLQHLLKGLTIHSVKVTLGSSEHDEYIAKEENVVTFLPSRGTVRS